MRTTIRGTIVWTLKTPGATTKMRRAHCRMIKLLIFSHHCETKCTNQCTLSINMDSTTTLLLPRSLV